MHIPYPCPKKLTEMQKTSSGYYCGDCKRNLIDTTNPVSAIPVKGDCIITNEPQEKYHFLNRTYRFAWVVFIVMGSTLITNNSVQANDLIEKLEKIRMVYSDDTTLLISGEVSDTEGKAIKPVKVTVITQTGDTIKQVNYTSSRARSSFYFFLPFKFANTSLTIKLHYFDEEKTVHYIPDSDKNDGTGYNVPEVQFKRNRKDRFTSKRYPYYTRSIGFF